MWSTHVAASIRPRSAHSTHVGCCCKYSLDTFDHRAVYPRSCRVPRAALVGRGWGFGLGRYCLGRLGIAEFYTIGCDDSISEIDR
ncbi:unnamed protein product [Gemmata massiliana]|uniref:Uncharacterized protein n=1 Tax=Gemmata massiliana TaxID=1210884 RepID=A0A6P2DKQ4_9BACT|nr:unnamed protein product [Gemmata massiliana]